MRKSLKGILVLSLISQAISSSYALTPAQQASIIQTQVDPGLTQKRISDQLPSFQATGAASIHRPEQKESEASVAQSKIKFKLNDVIIKGNTVFSTDQIKDIFRPSLHKEISLADLQKMVNQITTKYRSQGYVLTRAFLPAQVIKNGVVTVQIVEGFISKIAIEGNAGWTDRVLQRYGQHVLDSRPMQIKTLERSLLLMNDLPGTSVKAVIKPSADVKDAADLTLVTDQKTFNGFLSYDTFGTRYIGPQEIGAGVSLNSVTFPGSNDSLQYMTVPKPQSLKFIQYDHVQPVGDNGGKFAIGGNYTNTEPLFVLEPLHIVGRSQFLYADYSYPWVRSRDVNFLTHIAGNYENVSSTILSGPFYNDLVRSIIFGGDFVASDRFRGVNDIKIDFEKGLKLLGAKQHLLVSRPLGIPDYFKTDITVSRLQALPLTLTGYISLQGQYSCEPLYAVEQYAFGGSIYGRGYDPAEIVGDDGFAAKVELRKDVAYGKTFLSAVQYYVFYDAGIVWNRDGINLLPKQSATSVGTGARISFLPHLSGNVFYAVPLTHSRATQVISGKDPYAARVLFQLIASV